MRSIHVSALLAAAAALALATAAGASQTPVPPAPPAPALAPVPAGAESLVLAAEAGVRCGQWPAARACAESALARRPEPGLDARAHQALARAWRGEGEQALASGSGSWREAAQDFHAAALGDPNDADAWFGLARALRAGYDATGDDQLLAASTRSTQFALGLNPRLAGARELLRRDRSVKAKTAGL